MRLKPLSLALATLVVALIPLTTTAVTQDRKILQVATGLCGSNNPVNDQYLRRLPSGIRNSGTVNISVVCSQWADENTVGPASQVFAYFRNDKAVAYNVTCTLSEGIPFYGQVTSTKTVSVPAAGSDFISWSTADYGSADKSKWTNLQCSLPQAFTIREIGMTYPENVGT